MMSIITGIFRMDLWRVREFGETAKETSTLVNGRTIRPTDMVYTSLARATIKVINPLFRVLL
jgi:hypothetical protein